MLSDPALSVDDRGEIHATEDAARDLHGALILSYNFARVMFTLWCGICITCAELRPCVQGASLAGDARVPL